MHIQNLKDCLWIFTRYSVSNAVRSLSNVASYPVEASPVLHIFLLQMFPIFQHHLSSYLI